MTTTKIPTPVEIYWHSAEEIRGPWKVALACLRDVLNRQDIVDHRDEYIAAAAAGVVDAYAELLLLEEWGINQVPVIHPGMREFLGAKDVYEADEVWRRGLRHTGETWGQIHEVECVDCMLERPFEDGYTLG